MTNKHTSEPMKRMDLRMFLQVPSTCVEPYTSAHEEAEYVAVGTASPQCAGP